MRSAHLIPSLSLSLCLVASAAAAQTTEAPPPANAPATPWQSAPPPAPAVANDAAEVRAVEQLLATLDANNRERRVLSLAVGLGGGALVTGTGAFMLARNDSPRWESNPGLYVGAAGVGLILGGLINLAVPSYLHELGDAWRLTEGMPAAARRAQFGHVLDQLADRARGARRFAGWFSLGVGVVFVATSAVLYAARDHSSDGLIVSPEFVLGVGGALFMASSVPTLSLLSPIEHAAMFWRAGAARPSVQFAGLSVLPTRGGALGGVTLAF